MARRPRIALFAPASPLYVNVLMGLRAGFAELGVDAHAGWPLPDGRLLTAFLGNFRPDAILEINRCRDQITGCDVPCRHLAWMQDFQYEGQRLLDRFGGSDLFYFMLPPDIYGIDPETLPAWRYLWPGVNPDIHHPALTEPRWDLSLVGHMYSPPPDTVMRATIEAGGQAVGTFAEFAEAFLASPIGYSDIRLRAVHGFLVEQCARRGVAVDPDTLDGNALFLFDEVLLRIKDRRAVADAMLRVSPNVRFFGGPGWVLWPDYARRYGGELVDPHDLAAVYRASRLNVNNSAWPLHFRTLDAMGCGGAVMINRLHRPDVDEHFHTDFQPGTHYVAYGPADFEEAAARTLRDDAARTRMGAAAARVIAEKHLWRHRAEQILADLDAL
ncbi:glycosyltransferase family protein [Azospirillum isscasi]|uniref:Glycosyltransferase n=1 Tax=Azospirillum isscasi TaxID=3053926 RepID=A0ABU0WJ38_9PROT|nr:glycosyltransferase [Azospirillum isscasi]MDQ2104234.1 glycosyltransferase [Azospirillum isscasi]